MKKLAPLLVLLYVLLSGCQTQTSLLVSGEYRLGMGRFDRAMIALMEKWDMPGGSLAVVKDGEVLLVRGYGYADRESEVPVQPEALFRVASISKPITAVAVLKLVEDGRLDLDTPAFQLLDELQPLDPAGIDPRIETITVRHLLEHSGGWDSSISSDPMFRTREIAEEMGVTPPADCPMVIRYMLGKPLDFDPGSRYAYSNFGYCVLGRVIKAASGQSYQDYVNSHILNPIGIYDMRLGRSLAAEQAKGEVHYFAREPEQARSVFPEIWKPVPWPYGGFYLEAMDSHGGWIASAVDLARFASVLEDGNSRAVLNGESLASMVARPNIPQWEGASSYYGLGWHVRPGLRNDNMWHTGSLPGSTGVLYCAADGLVWAVLFNSNPDSSGDAFLVDLITVMGRAAFMDELLWAGGILLVCLLAGGVVLVRRRKRKK
jgi:N-acyl-D-amino-acid deacylase